MSAMSNYLETALIDHIFRYTSFSRPGTIAVALYWADPGEAGSIGGSLGTNEMFAYGVNGSLSGYGRVGVPTANGTEWAATTAGNATTSNVNPIIFPQATESWTKLDTGSTTVAPVIGAALMDSTTVAGSNMLFFGTLTTQKTVNKDDVFQFSAGNFTVKLDDA